MSPRFQEFRQQVNLVGRHRRGFRSLLGVSISRKMVVEGSLLSAIDIANAAVVSLCSKILELFCIIAWPLEGFCYASNLVEMLRCLLVCR